MSDGSREPIRANEAETIMAQIEAGRVVRREQLPDLKACLTMLGRVSERMRELGWKDAIYCPKDGSPFEAIEFGSTGIHVAGYEGKWPKGSWWVYGGGDMWPSRPILWRPLSEGRNGCTIPPDGWFCTRTRGHEGPCAAIERVDGPTPKETDHG
jgi:hypothetical protein|tara:strand:+ start:200 stop:661 length:462 start_codon:yes stop_codon:yes gene_type:complete